MAKYPRLSRKHRETEVGSAEFKTRCLELIDHVKESRAEFVVTRHGTPVAKLVPVDVPVPASAFGTMKGTVLQYDRPFDPVPAAWSINQTGDADTD